MTPCIDNAHFMQFLAKTEVDIVVEVGNLDIFVQSWALHSTPSKNIFGGKLTAPYPYGVGFPNMICVCRSAHYIKIPGKERELKPPPIHSHPIGWGLENLSFLCKSAHFVQFQASGYEAPS